MPGSDQQNEKLSIGDIIDNQLETHDKYKVGQSERWIADHILRWIPGSGY